jgi:hypothetical protein
LNELYVGSESRDVGERRHVPRRLFPSPAVGRCSGSALVEIGGNVGHGLGHVFVEELKMGHVRMECVEQLDYKIRAGAVIDAVIRPQFCEDGFLVGRRKRGWSGTAAHWVFVSIVV